MDNDGRVFVTWAEVEAAAALIAEVASWADAESRPTSVYGVPRGGLVPAAMVAARLGVPLTDYPEPGCLVVDDLVDSGATLRRFAELPQRVHLAALFAKPTAAVGRLIAEPYTRDGWLVFPWEVGTPDEAGPADAVVRLLEYIGEDPSRPGLVDTPGRVVRALAEMTAGYTEDPATVLGTRFPDTSHEMVVVRGIDFTSLCEHHLLTFTGTATVGYLPEGEVVGLSKFARLVDTFARRLQVQERMTEQIADAIAEHTVAAGVGVVVRATHSCMACRGVRKPGAEMVTSALRGRFADATVRAEFMALALG